jgi:hypothetical protein
MGCHFFFSNLKCGLLCGIVFIFGRGEGEENSKVGGLIFLESGDLKCDGICDFLVWKKIEGNAKKEVVVLLILRLLIQFFFQI